jgi:hypothetical protein
MALGILGVRSVPAVLCLTCGYGELSVSVCVSYKAEGEMPMPSGNSGTLCATLAG